MSTKAKEPTPELPWWAGDETFRTAFAAAMYAATNGYIWIGYKERTMQKLSVFLRSDFLSFEQAKKVCGVLKGRE